MPNLLRSPLAISCILIILLASGNAPAFLSSTDRTDSSARPSGTCRPVYFQDTFRRVYRQNKMFLEGVTDITGDGKPDAYGYEHLANGAFQNIVILPNDNAGGFGDPIVVSTTL